MRVHKELRLVIGAIIGIGSGAFGALANGIYRDAAGARALAVGGADVAWAAAPLGAMSANPAGLGFYAYHLPVEQHVGRSRLEAGEFNNSRVKISLHQLAVSLSFRF